MSMRKDDAVSSSKILVLIGFAAVVGVAGYLCAHPHGDFNAAAPGEDRSTGIYEIDIEKQGSATVRPAFDKNEQYRKPFTPGTDPGASARRK